jgi:hypothetical protein
MVVHTQAAWEDLSMRRCNSIAVALVSLASVIALTPTGCVGSDDREVVPIDERAGSFRGIAVGEKVPPNLAEVLGQRCDPGATLTPCEVDQITGVHSIRGEWAWENYEAVTVLTYAGDVQALVIADENAETTEGVAIGDQLSEAKERYQGLDCGLMPFHDSTGPPYCVGELGDRNRIIFGGDPVDSIAIGRGIG